MDLQEKYGELFNFVEWLTLKQLLQFPSDLKSDGTTILFHFQPPKKKDHLTFQLDSFKPIENQIPICLMQANISEDNLKDKKCHFEYYHFTNHWVIIDKLTKLKNFAKTDNEFYEIRFRFH
tara:strand:- start:579 stop:941 length:363 start_codon:yes stop_codon:yes gene_type:complete